MAEQLGISKSTVSLALSRPADQCPLAADTRERIIDSALAMGYRPNAIARTMRTGRFNAVALLAGSVTPSYMPWEIVQGAEQALQRVGQHLIFSSIDDERFTDESYVPKVLDQWACDGLLIHYTHRFPSRMLELITRYQVPSIWINTKLPADCVYPDDFGAATMATRRLIEMGHRRIAYANLVYGGHYSETDRQSGYEAAMQEAGLAPQVIALGEEAPSHHPRPESRLALADRVVAAADRATAILCYETATAGPLSMAALRRGLSIPGDLSLVTFGKILRNDTGLPFTTVLVPILPLGVRAAEMVVEKIAKPNRKLPAVCLPCTWHDGATCERPRN